MGRGPTLTELIIDGKSELEGGYHLFCYFGIDMYEWDKQSNSAEPNA